MGEFKQLIFVHQPIQLIFQIGELPLRPRRSQEEEIPRTKGEEEEGEGGTEEERERECSAREV